MPITKSQGLQIRRTFDHFFKRQNRIMNICRGIEELSISNENRETADAGDGTASKCCSWTSTWSEQSPQAKGFRQFGDKHTCEQYERQRISSCLCCTSQQHDYANEAEPHGFRANQRHNPLRNMNASPRYKGTSPLLLVLWGALQSGVFLPICLLSGKCKSSSYSLFTVMWLGSLSELVIHVMFLFIDLLSKLHPGEQWPTITKQMK